MTGNGLTESYAKGVRKTRKSVRPLGVVFAFRWGGLNLADVSLYSRLSILVAIISYPSPLFGLGFPP